MIEHTTRDSIHAIAVDQAGLYRIIVQGRLRVGAKAHFDEFDLAESKSVDGTFVTTLTGRVVDQAALHGVVARIRDLGLPLILLELLDPLQEATGSGTASTGGGPQTLKGGSQGGLNHG